MRRLSSWSVLIAGLILLVGNAFAASVTSTEWVQKAYIAYYGRPGDSAGIEYWAGRLDDSGGALSGIIEAFGSSQEFTDNYGSLNNSQLIDKIYQQMFNRDPDPDGKTWYIEQLNSGSMTLQSITLSVLNGAQNEDLSIISNKLAVATYYTGQLIYLNDVICMSSLNAKNLLSSVDETAASVDNAKKSVDDWLLCCNTTSVPGSPTIETATSGNGRVTVTFTAPSSNGWCTITGYIVTSNPGGKTSTGTTSPITVTGLTNGTTYTFTVQANNAVGTGPASKSVTLNAGPTSKLPDTGQITSYTDTFGEDSDYTINSPSYTKLDSNGNALPDEASEWAMVKDNVTDLIWENKTAGEGINGKDNKYTWQNAKDGFIAQLNNERFGGHSDWRLPTVKELTTLRNRNQWDMPINTAYFINASSSSWSPINYWSSTANAENLDNAWFVDFSTINGTCFYFNKSDDHYVRAVCGEKSELFDDSIIQGRMIDNKDGTVTDTESGLMWQQAEAENMSWDAALAYCENLQLGNHNDWRLPNTNELQSIVDYSNYNPAIDTTVFPSSTSKYWDFWSSTSFALNSNFAWIVSFPSGSVGYIYMNGYDKSHLYYVRAVRGGN